MSAPKVKYAEVADNGLPTGGTTGQVPTKQADGSTAWADAGGAVDSVNGKTGAVVLNAADIALADTAENFASAGVEGAMAELFTSVSNGKTALVADIQAKGGAVTVSGDVASFDELSDGILSIPTGGGNTYQSKTVTPNAAGQTVAPDAGYDALSSVIINADADLIAGNIKSGVNIFGVTGTYGTPPDYSVKYTRVARANDQDLGTGYTVVSWETEVNDDDGCFISSNPTRLTVPTGKTQVSLTAYVAFSTSLIGSRSVKIVKNGSTEICSKSIVARNETAMCLATGILTVAEGDYFEVQAQSGSSSYDLLGASAWGGPSWFEMCTEPLAAGLITRVSLLANFDAAAAWNDIGWAVILRDDNNGACWNPSSPTMVTVPAGFTKARFRALVSMATTAISAGRNVQIHQSGQNPVAGDFHTGVYGGNFYVDTGWITVTSGQQYLTSVYSDSGYDVAGLSSPFGPSWFEIELAP